MLKYIIIVLLASFLFSCAAEAQSKKELVTGDAVTAVSPINPNTR